MRNTPRFFSRQLSTAESRVYRAASLWFVVAAVLMVWPAYAWIARVRPLVLGMPFALFWLALVLIASFLVGLALFRWEDRAGLLDRDADRDRGPTLPAEPGD